VCAGEVWSEGGFTLVLFQGWDVGSEVLLEQVQLDFSLRNKFIIFLPCGLLGDNNTIIDLVEGRIKDCNKTTVALSCPVLNIKKLNTLHIGNVHDI